MELRAVIVECSTAFTGMCKLCEHCCTFLARQLQQQSGVSPGCCTSRGHGPTWPRRRQGRAWPFLADSAVTLKPFPVDAPPGRPGPLPAGPPDHSPWQPPDCSPARLCAAQPVGCVPCVLPNSPPRLAGGWSLRALPLCYQCLPLGPFSHRYFSLGFSASQPVVGTTVPPTDAQVFSGF